MSEIDPSREKAIEDGAKSTGRRVNFNYVDTTILERRGIDRYDTKKPKGNNFIRIVTPSKTGPFAKEVWKHSNVGTDGNAYLCLEKMFGKKCLVCEYIRKLKREGADDDVIQPLVAGRRYLMFVVDTTSEETEEEGPKWFDCPPTIYQQICSLSIDKRTGKRIDPTDPEEGRDIEFTRVDGKRTSYGSFELKETNPVPKSWYEGLPSFDEVLLIPDEEEVARTISGVNSSEEDEKADFKSTTREEKDEKEPIESESDDSKRASSVRQKLAEIESRRRGQREKQ